MQRTQITISSLLYFILVSSLTNLTFLVTGIAFLTLFSVKLSGFGLQIIIFLLLWKGGLVGLVSWLFRKKANNKDFLVKFIGIYLGRFFGLLFGGFLGARILSISKQSEIIGFIVGALAFYFAGRWVGSKVSILIGNKLDKIFLIQETQESDNIPVIKLTNKLTSIGFIVYGLILPLLFVIIGLLMIYFKIPISFHNELLPISRIVVIVLSIFSICSPWLIKNHMINKYQAIKSLPESVFYWLGLICSIVPVIFGFTLYIAMGASILELFLFAAVSSFSAILWGMNYKVTLKQTAG